MKNYKQIAGAGEGEGEGKLGSGRQIIRTVAVALDLRDPLNVACVRLAPRQDVDDDDDGDDRQLQIQPEPEAEPEAKLSYSLSLSYRYTGRYSCGYRYV